MPAEAGYGGRRLVHTRRVVCQGFERNDGLWDIEVTLVDTKPHDVALLERHLIPADEPIHEITLRLAVDRSLLIHEVEVRFFHSPYQVCPSIVSSYQRLVGMLIGPGFVQATRELFRRTSGCTHATELIGPAASAAYQTLWNQLGGDGPFDPSSELPDFAVGGCHALSEDGVIVKLYSRG